jgi:hypothetical protein
VASFSVRPKPNNCIECAEPIRKESTRCRVCQTRRAQKGNVVARRIIPGRGLTGAEAQRRWRALHPERSLEVGRETKRRRKTQIDTYKAEIGCQDCGISDPRVLDLHHRPDEEKIAHVNVLRTRAGWGTVRAEMEKCDVLCANCHRIRHAEELGYSAAYVALTGGTFFRAA